MAYSFKAVLFLLFSHGMKVHSITLNNYNQFKDLVIDLTYPEGHPKAGQPLDKVCFIGQSGTGKTTLLRLIKLCVTFNGQIGENVFFKDIGLNTISMNISFDNYFFNSVPTKDWVLVENCLPNPKNNDWYSEFESDRNRYIEKNRPILINFPTEHLSNVKDDNFEHNYISSFDKENFRLDYLKNLNQNSFIDFSYEDKIKALDYLKQSIKNYKLEELELKQKIANEAISKNSKFEDLKKLTDEFNEWLNSKPNPLEELINYLNPTLHQLGLKIKEDFDTKLILQSGDISLQTLDGKDVAREFWSTGTKQIIDTVVPLYEIKPKNAILLIDEPERSLYPNLQQQIIDLYTSVGDNCQYFFATHSPIIASSFDPWEIVELKYDETSAYVIQELNYEGERHIDNYTVYPKHLGWSGILMKLFDLTEEGNQQRNEELLNLVILKNDLDALKKEGKNKGKTFDKKLETFIKLKQKVGWNETA